MRKLNYNTTLEDLLEYSLVSLKTYNSLLSHYKSLTSNTKLYDIYFLLDNLRNTNAINEDALAELENICSKIILPPYTTLKELLDNGYISVRSYNVLRFDASLGYSDETPISVIKREFSNPFELLKLRNFGKKSFVELSNVFSLLPIEDYSTVENKTLFIEDSSIVEERKPINKLVLNIINAAYEDAFCDDNIYTLFIKAKYPTVEDIHFEVLNDYHNLFSFCEGFNIDGNKQIRQYILNYVRYVINKRPDINSLNISTYNIYAEVEEYVKVEENLNNNINYFLFVDRYKFLLDDFKKDYIYKCYLSLCDSTISIRTKHFIDKHLPSFEKFLPYLDKSNNCLLDELSKYICRTSKTLVEIIDLCSRIRDKFSKIEQYDNHALTLSSLKCQYPFLVMKQRDFVARFLNQYGKIPHFYLLYQYLNAICSSHNEESRGIRIYCQYYGLFDGIERSLDEIAIRKRLSRERIRQLSTIKEVRKVLKREFPIDINEYVNLLNKPIIYSNDIDFLQLKEIQNLNFDFRAFGIMFCIYADFRYINYRDFEIIISNRLFKSKPIEKILETIIYKATLRHPKDECVSIYEFIPKSSKYIVEKKELLYKALKTIIPSNIEFCDDIIIYKQNCIDVTSELVAILEENGKPMFLQELFTAFKQKYPEHKYDNPYKLRANIRKPIKAIGKQSKYGLEYWSDVYWGSIRDLLIECIENSEDPVHIDKLLNVVIIHYPNTNIKNIASSLSSDELDRFVQFEGGFYGLANRIYSERFIKSAIVHRYSFEDRLKMYCNFIETYHRFPLSNGGELEASLQRWCNNVFTGAVETSEEEINKLNKSINYYENLNYPRNAFEAEFLNKCKEFKEFILENHCMPSQMHGKELYRWMRRSKDNMNSYTDKRRLYFLDLLSYISSFGFKV